MSSEKRNKQDKKPRREVNQLIKEMGKSITTLMTIYTELLEVISMTEPKEKHEMRRPALPQMKSSITLPKERPKILLKGVKTNPVKHEIKKLESDDELDFDNIDFGSQKQLQQAQLTISQENKRDNN